MNETYTPDQHQHLIDEARRAAQDGTAIRTLNGLLRTTFADADDKNRDYIAGEFWTWFEAFRGLDDK